jgi:DNA adenine methylase
MLNSVISWVGGKRLLRKQIIPLIPKHDTYCEVFGGAGWVLFGKSADKKDWLPDSATRGRGYTEVYNDINGDLVNFWRYIKMHPEAFAAELNTFLVGRETFEEFKAGRPRTELEKAVWFYYKLACSYGSQSKNFSIMHGHRYMPLRNEERVKEASERLRDVIIENMDFERLIARYDGPDTFFYLDPPYYTKERLYERDDAEAFTRHEDLAAILKGIRGKFLLSYNDDPYIRELYSGCVIEEVEATYSVSGQKQRQVELLIRNN